MLVGRLGLIDGGLISLRIESVGADVDFLDCAVDNSGAVSNHKGVNLPNVDVDLPAVSAKDKGVKLDVDMVFASFICFIRKVADVEAVRRVLVAADVKIIAKIENHECVRNFDAILGIEMRLRRCSWCRR